MAERLWRGPSAYDGQEITLDRTAASTNRKTGPVDQLWVLVAGEAPHDAVQSGADAAVCGDCPHRREHGKLGDCYVLPFQAPLGIYRSLEDERGGGSR